MGSLPAPGDKVDPRFSTMRRLYLAGASLAEIGERYGLTRQRVYQILMQQEPGLSELRRRSAAEGHTE